MAGEAAAAFGEEPGPTSGDGHGDPDGAGLTDGAGDDPGLAESGAVVGAEGD